MIVRKLRLFSSSTMPIIIGLCLGVALSLIIAPFLEENCGNEAVRSESKHIIRGRKTNAVDEEQSFDYGNEDAFTPILRKSEIAKEDSGISKQHNKKLLRARYASTELGIREKILVSVVTSPDTIDSLGVSINRTMAHYVTKTMFFMASRPAVLPNEMSVVSFASSDNMKIYHMLKYINNHYAQNYDYFFFMPDNTYVRGQQLMDIVLRTSVAQSVHLGVPYVDGQKQEYCSLKSGILLSNVRI